MQRVLSVVTIAVVIIALGFGGVMASVAWNNHVKRGYVSSGLKLAGRIKRDTNAYYAQHKFFPKSNEEIGIDKPITTEQINDIRLTDFRGVRILIEFKPGLGLTKEPSKMGQLVLKPMVMDTRVYWRCAAREGNILEKYRPQGCRRHR